jgi:sn-glycerol 3-phosphate transport system ATP-binding protein
MADISLRRVAKSYGRTPVVHALDLEIRSGEFVVVLGPSGCGKSTVLRMIAGLEEITSGDIAIGGRIVNDLEPRERGCAMVFQNYALYPHMTVADNMGYALRVAGVPKKERRARVEAVALTLGLSEFLDRRPAQLSGGQRQRVAMGRAMIRSPEVFLFDEPLSNLDAKLRVQMRIEIRRLHNRLGATSVFVTHDQVEAMTLADRIVVLEGGRIEQIGTPSEVYHRPASRFVAGFIGSPPMNLIEGTVAGDRTIAFADGSDLHLPGLALERGRKVVVGIRPESLSVGLAALDRPVRQRFDLQFVEHLGPAALAHGLFAGAAFVAQVATDLAVGSPEGLAFGCEVEAVHLFDAADGRRIDGALDGASRPTAEPLPTTVDDPTASA